MRQWKRDEIELLIQLYENYPVLYAVGQSDYHNRNKKRAAYESLTNELNALLNLDAQINVEEVKNKLLKLRTQFIENLNKVTSSKGTGTATQDVFEPTWVFYDQLKFIQSHIIHRKGKSNLTSKIQHLEEADSQHIQSCSPELFLTESEAESTNLEVLYDDFVPVAINDSSSTYTPITSPDFDADVIPQTIDAKKDCDIKARSESVMKKKKVSTASDTQTMFYEDARRALSVITSPPEIHAEAKVEDELDHFFNYVKAEVRKLEEEGVDYIKNGIFSIVQEAKLQYKKKN